MVLVEGTNYGFCSSAPSADPSTGAASTIDDNAATTKTTSPATAEKITEVGFYAPISEDTTNFEVGLYAADGGVVPGEAGTLLEVSRTNTISTGAGWKVVTGLNWSISPSTAYWLGAQVDGIPPNRITLARSNSTNDLPGRDFLGAQSTLPDPFGGGAISDANDGYAIYAVYEEAAATWDVSTSTYINIGDVWTPGVAYINVGDVWTPATQTLFNTSA